MRAIIQLGEDNWQPIYSGNHEVSYTADGRGFTPMPEINVTGYFLPLNSPILAVHATSTTAKRTWHVAGWLVQRVRSGLVVGGLPDADLGKRRIPLNQLDLIFWELLLTNFIELEYQIFFQFPPWIRTLNLQVWKYTGAVTDQVMAELNFIRSDLAGIERKIDILNR